MKDAIASGGVLGHKTRPARKSASPRSAVLQLAQLIAEMIKLIRTQKQQGLSATQLTADEAQLAFGKDDIQIR